MSKYKVMVVGLGKRGKHHAEYFHKNENFEVVYKRIQTNSILFEGEKNLWDDIYFIGKKR